jgi:hypothetical protein
MRRHGTPFPRLRLRRRLYLQINADNFFLAILQHHPRALAEVGKAYAGALAKFEPAGNDNTVDFPAGPSPKVKNNRNTKQELSTP